MPHNNPTIEDRFLNRVEQRWYGCWIWLGAKNTKGYGHVRLNGRQVSVHRLSWTLFNTDIPHGLFVLHTCDNKACCNPDHLRLGTHAENMAESSARGRHINGEAHHKAKLTRANVKNILDLKGVKTQEDIARSFGVSQSLVSLIHRGSIWRSVTAHACR